jgi:preprotein translocase subunit YajC
MEFGIVWFAIIAVAFFLLIVRPQRRQRQAHRAFVAALEPGAQVVTIGGIHGIIRSLDDDTVALEVAPGMVVTVARTAIAAHTAPDVPDSPGTAGPHEVDRPQADGNGGR